jgi:excisionase family DNA binding protein
MDGTRERAGSRNSVAVISLADLLEDPRKVGEMSHECVLPFLCQLLALMGTLTARLLIETRESKGRHELQRPDTRLLTVAEAATQLGVSQDWIYRRAGKLPFTVRLGPRRLRFSAEGINRFIHQRQGRA